MGISCRVYQNAGNNTRTFDESQIILNPTISKAICTGGFSVGNVSSACLKVGVPDYGYTKDTKVQIFYNDYQIMGDFYISTIEKCGLAPLSGGWNNTQMVMLTCYDDMTKLDDYLSLDGVADPIEADALCELIETMSGFTFEDGSKMASGLAIPLEDIKSKTVKEILGIFGCYAGCNYMIHSYNLNNSYVSRITQVPLYYSGNSFAAEINSKVTVEEPICFTRVITRGGSDAYIDGDADTGETLTISCKYADNASNSIIRGNISDTPYQAFKCDHALTRYVSLDAGDKITLDGASNGLMMYDFTLTLSVRGLYLSCGADTQKKTINDEDNKSGGSSLPQQITNFIAGTSGQAAGTIDLTWTNPTSNFDGVVIKRKKGAPMASIYEGEIVYASNGKEHIDTIPLPYYDYYYRAVTWLGDYWNGKLNQIKVTAIQRGKYLYNAGDLCTSLTGGWGGGCSVVATNLFTSNYNNSLLKFNADHALIDTFEMSDKSYRLYGIRTVNKINFEGFTKVCAEVEVTDIVDFDVSHGYGDNTVNTQGTPFYDYTDTWIGGTKANPTTPPITATDYPYIVVIYRTKQSYYYPYYVYFLKNKPALAYNATGQQCLLVYGSMVSVSYRVINGIPTRWDAGTATSTRLIPLVHAPGIGDTNTYGDYMGGGYADGNYVYYMSVNPDVVPDGRVFAGTLQDNNYMYTDCVSFEKGTKIGEYVIKADIKDIDNSTNPPTRTGYVCVGGFESNTKVKAIWLEP